MAAEGLELFNLTGKTALVTGGSKGLGKSMARGLAQAGAKIALCSRNGNEAQQAADEIAKDFEVQTLAFECDVTSEEEVSSMMEETFQKLGSLDVLINNAGINIRNPIEELSLDDFKQVMDINVTGPWLCCRAALPYLKQGKDARVINISSTLGAVALAGRTPYASSKGAVTMMTKVLALEWAPLGINVNAICPGPFLTEMNIPIKDSPDAKKFIIGAVCLERWGEMPEIQGAANFLASSASSFVTGTTLFVDGGWTAR